MNSISRAMDAMLGPAAGGKQRDALVRDLKARGFGVNEFRADTRDLDQRTAQSVAALARQGLAVTDASGSPLGDWNAI